MSIESRGLIGASLLVVQGMDDGWTGRFSKGTGFFLLILDMSIQFLPLCFFLLSLCSHRSFFPIVSFEVSMWFSWRVYILVLL